MITDRHMRLSSLLRVGRITPGIDDICGPCTLFFANEGSSISIQECMRRPIATLTNRLRLRPASLEKSLQHHDTSYYSHRAVQGEIMVTVYLYLDETTNEGHWKRNHEHAEVRRNGVSANINRAPSGWCVSATENLGYTHSCATANTLNHNTDMFTRQQDRPLPSGRLA